LLFATIEYPSDLFTSLLSLDRSCYVQLQETGPLLARHCAKRSGLCIIAARSQRAKLQAVQTKAMGHPMGLEALIIFLVIGAVAGWLAGQVMSGGGFGLVGDVIVGVIGSIIGGWLFGVLGIAAGGLLGAIIAAFVGAVILLAILRAIKRA
jgi:uncharacterized membrane protein YeaQ/YmgE (transglycosylase-associated protein family)